MTELPKTITRSSIDSTLRSAGINCLYAETAKEVIELLSSLNAMTKFTEYQIVLVNIALYHSQNLDRIIEACESVSLPLLVIVSQDKVGLIEPHLGIADFITYPINNQSLHSTQILFQWDQEIHADSYNIEISTDENFENKL